MKKYLLFVVILVLSLLSCSKEDMKVHDSQQEQISFAAGRLSFASSQKFVNCIETLKNYYYDDLKYEKKLESIIGKKNFIAFKKLAYKKNGTVDSLDFEEDTLVNDPVFRSLLNHKYEIEVEGTIYKITPFGTFAFKPDKYEKVLAIIQLLEEQKQISEVQLSNYLYQVDTGIIRYDTFKEIEDNTILVSEAQVAKNGHLKNSVNDDIITYYIDKKQTIVGEFLQNTFGISKKIIRSHSSKRRFYFSLSSPNYIVLTYVSVAIGFQKENWIGWSKTTADKMVLGWDGLIIKTNVSMTLPEKPKFDEFGNLYWSKAETQPYFSPYTYAVIYLPEFNIYFSDKWNFQFNNQIIISDREFYKVIRGSFNWLKSKFSSNLSQHQHLIVIPNNRTMFFSPEERVREYAGYMSETFDYAIGISFKWNMHGSINPANFGASPISVILNEGSFYGKVYYAGVWKGIRICKDW